MSKCVVTYCPFCDKNIAVAEPCSHFQSLLRKIRIHSNKQVEIHSLINDDESNLEEISELAIDADFDLLKRINQFFMEHTPPKSEREL